MDEARDAFLKTGQYFSTPGPVPPVDPTDLRNVWELMQKASDLAQKAHASLPKAETEALARSGRQLVYDFRGLGLPVPANAGCSPGADVGAVWYRAKMLGMMAGLAYFKQMGERVMQRPPVSDIANLPDLDYSHPSDAVFKALAVVPMTGLALGAPPLKGFPVDLKEFTRLISG